MELTIERLQHSLTVARKMKAFIEQNRQIYSCSPEDMFYLGMLHDIGYEFVEKQDEHEIKGGEILRKQGYKFWQEVFYHGNPDSEYKSPELDLLNYCDMTTGPNGENMTVEERINDIIQRYGENSHTHLKSLRLCKKMGL